MNATNHIIAQYDVLDGPSIHNIMDALLYAYSSSPLKLQFKIKTNDGTLAYFMPKLILGIDRGGYIDRNIFDIRGRCYNGESFHGWYNAATRTGILWIENK